MPRRTKQDVIDDILSLVSAAPQYVSRGSTEPKDVFLAIDQRLGLGLDDRQTKPELAEAIAASAGVPWDAECDSRGTPSGGGSTVTLVGLERVLTATRALTQRAQEEVTSFGTLPPSTPIEDEIRAILSVLDRWLPRRRTGHEAVEELRAAGGRWRDVEWPGFYFEHAARSSLVQELGGDMGPRFGRTEFDYRLIRVFDLKTHSAGSFEWMWLNDQAAVEAAVLETGGLGFIIVEGRPTADLDKAFQHWHDRLKGPPSEYSQARAARGAPSRPRKAAFAVTDLWVAYLDGLAGLRRGLIDGWLRIAEQGRQARGGPRKPKYQLRPRLVPPDCRFVI